MPSESAHLYKHEQAALERLFTLAKRETEQSSIAADFLLAWWDAKEYRGFDLTTLWSVDRVVAQDLLIIFSLIVRERVYPDILGFAHEFPRIIDLWRRATPGPKPGRSRPPPSSVVPKPSQRASERPTTRKKPVPKGVPSTRHQR